jgi:hypothetical protein
MHEAILGWGGYRNKIPTMYIGMSWAKDRELPGRTGFSRIWYRWETTCSNYKLLSNWKIAKCRSENPLQNDEPCNPGCKLFCTMHPRPQACATLCSLSACQRGSSSIKCIFADIPLVEHKLLRRCRCEASNFLSVSEPLQ